MANLLPIGSESSAIGDAPVMIVPNFVAQAPSSILGMTGNDVVIYGKGSSGILTVASQTTTEPGELSITVTLENGDVLACSNANTVLSSFSINAQGEGITTWVYSQ